MKNYPTHLLIVEDDDALAGVEFHHLLPGSVAADGGDLHARDDLARRWDTGP